MKTTIEVYGDPVRGRSCAGCKACCTLVPVRDTYLDKNQNQRCPHVRSKGCGIYSQRPRACRAWSCRWLFDVDAAGLKRPDHAGYIVDPDLDTFLESGKPYEMLQVWIDPARPLAHRDPDLRAYLAFMAATYGLPAIARWAPDQGIMLFAPALTVTGDWIEQTGNMMPQAKLDELLRDHAPVQYEGTFA